jgi:hypothetical protein
MAFDDIREEFASGKVDKGLQNLLQQLASSDQKVRSLRDDLLILNSRFEDLKRRDNIGSISPEEFGREKAKILDAALKIINQLEHPEEQPPLAFGSSPATSSSKWKWYLLAGVSIAAVLIVIGIVSSNNDTPGSSEQEQQSAGALQPAEDPQATVPEQAYTYDVKMNNINLLSDEQVIRRNENHQFSIRFQNLSDTAVSNLSYSVVYSNRGQTIDFDYITPDNKQYFPNQIENLTLPEVDLTDLILEGGTSILVTAMITFPRKGMDRDISNNEITQRFDIAKRDQLRD